MYSRPGYVVSGKTLGLGISGSASQNPDRAKYRSPQSDDSTIRLIRTLRRVDCK